MLWNIDFLGGSGLKVSALSFGTATFGGSNEFFKGFGSTEVDEARRLIDICFEAGVNLFDTANGYSEGRSEEILGKALAGKRDKALISTKSGFPTGQGRTTRDRAGTICGARSKAACGGWARTTSTFITCMALTR